MRSFLADAGGSSRNAMFRFEGQTALVTGASSGLGFEMAKALAEAGADVIVNSRSAANAEAAAKAIGHDARTAIFDATDRDAVSEALPGILSDRPPSILINNVGFRNRKGFFDYELSEVDAMLSANATAPFHLAREVARSMQARRHGRIINITSLTGPLARPVDQPYAMAKCALEGLTRSMAALLGKDGITVNAIAPGFFKTSANEHFVDDPDINAFVERRSALGRWGEPSEITGAALFLASREASYVTGQTLFVDGGMYGQY